VHNKDIEKWRDERRKGVGGSDVAGILGISEYSTPLTVWADKLGLTPHKDDTPNMRIGRDLEDYVAQRFVEATGLHVRRDSRTITNPAYPYSIAHIDRRISKTKSGGMLAGLECKTCTPYRREEFTEHEYPTEYHAQCLHYLAVTGWDTWYLAVLVLDGTFHVYEIHREDYQAEMDTVQAAVATFWEDFVLTGTKPPMDGKEATTKALSAIYDSPVEGCVDLSHLEEHFIEAAALKEQIDELQCERERHMQEIKAAMGENTRAECAAWVVNWKPRKDGVRVFSIKLQ